MVAIAYEPDYLCLTSFCSGPEFLVSPSWGVPWRGPEGPGKPLLQEALGKDCHFILKPESRSVISTFSR